MQTGMGVQRNKRSRHALAVKVRLIKAATTEAEDPNPHLATRPSTAPDGVG
jgi:hypothetical protein